MSLSIGELQELLGARFQLQRELGGGSMAAVYLAEDTRHRRQVAIKLLRPEYGPTIAAERFLREIEIAARLQHPHIVPLLDSGELAGNLYLVMPYIEGESLRVRLVREGRLPVSDAIRILGDVADALAYAHSKGIIHRDIKPDNILLAGRHALVTDFGVAKAVSAATLEPRDLTIGVALGTPAYMAPEQATASPDLDHRVDLYALGVVAYELLTGHPPFERPTAQAILTAHVLEPPPPILERRPDLSPALAAIVDRCLAKSAADRWQSAEQLLRQLEPLLTPSGGSTPASVAPVPTRSFWRWLPLAAAGLAIAGVAAVALWSRKPPGIGMSGVQRQITFSGQVTAAALSPDGQLLAFIADSGGRNLLMLQDLRGGQAIQLSSGSRLDYPSWSGDGSEVRCFVVDTNVSFVRRVARLGGSPRDLPVQLWAALSPSGDRLATVRQGLGLVTVRNFSTGDSAATQLEIGWWYSLPSWSPDGERLAWGANRQAGQGGRIWVSPARGLRPVVVLEDTLMVGVPGWDAKGEALFYLRSHGRVRDLMRLPLERDGRAAGTPEVIRAGLTGGNLGTYDLFAPAPSISSDGRRLVYTQRQDWSNLGVTDLEQHRQGKPPRMLTAGSTAYGDVRLSPDNLVLAVERYESEDLSLQLLPLDGTTPRELGRLQTDGGISWSPRGDRLVISAATSGGRRGLTIWALTGRPAERFGLDSVGDTPEWIDDSTIMVSRLGNRSLQTMVVPHGPFQRVAGLDTIGWMFWPRVSPEGKRVAFSWNQGDGKQGVFVLNLTDSSLTRIWNGLLDPVGWSTDGKRVFVVDAGLYADSSRVVALDAAGMKATPLGTFRPGISIADVTEDGKRAVVVVHEQRADAWSILFDSRR